MGHGADPVGVRGDEGRPAAQEVAGPVQLFIHEFGVEALHHHVDGVDLGVAQLIVDEVHAIAFELAVKGLRAGEVDARAGVALVEVHAGGHAGGEDILPLAGKTEALQTGNIILARTGGIVGQVDVLLAEARQILHQFDGALIDIVPQIQGPIHVEQKKFRIFQFCIVHILSN